LTNHRKERNAILNCDWPIRLLLMSYCLKAGSTVVSRKPQEIDQSQSNVKRIVDYDWLIPCGLMTCDSIVEPA